MPIACTLDSQAMGQRLAEIQRLTARHLRTHRVDGPTLRLTYGVDAAPEVARIVELERACCAFLDFELRTAADGIELAITAPAQNGSDAQWLFAQFLPQADAPARPAASPTECPCCRG
jgi:hypothetical protein